ncbi:hypothetical protein, partial [Acinetobacter baumannii]|uniref:hypothetical protein n=1 Tax=Acinetobacter baumannii TaxID=470 RepID=UPI001A7E8103
MTWIQEICDKGNLVFFYGFVPGVFGPDTDWPRPILSTYDRLIQGRPTHLVADTIFNGLSYAVTPEWVNHVAQTIEREGRPDVVYN